MANHRLFKKILFSRYFLPRSIRYPLIRSLAQISDLPEGVNFQLATSKEDFYGSYRLLHDVFVEEGFSKPLPSGIRTTIYHMLPTTPILIAKYKEKVIATLTIIQDDYFGLPMDEIVDFSQNRQKGERLAEISSLAIDPQYRKSSGKILFYLLKFMLLYFFNHTKIERFVISYHPDHATLYEAICGFTRIKKKPVQNYEFANGAPAVCGTLLVNELKAKYYRMYHTKPKHKNFYSFVFDGQNLIEKTRMILPVNKEADGPKPYLTLEMLSYFYAECTNLISTLSNQQLKYLKNIYIKSGYSTTLVDEYLDNAAIPN